MRMIQALFLITALAIAFWMTTTLAGGNDRIGANSAISMLVSGDPDPIFDDRFEVVAAPVETCADGAQCLVDCGDFSSTCVDGCTADLAAGEESTLMDLQFCAIEACFFLSQCTISDFNAPECVQCRLDVNVDPSSFGCTVEGMACGI